MSSFPSRLNINESATTEKLYWSILLALFLVDWIPRSISREFSKDCFFHYPFSLPIKTRVRLSSIYFGRNKEGRMMMITVRIWLRKLGMCLLLATV